MFNRTPKRIYLDYASTTPVDPQVLRAMLPYFSDTFGNPSALYKEGMVAKEAVAEARSTIAKLLHTRSEEIVFTGTGTEADNLALVGVVKAAKNSRATCHVITTTIEHPALLEACKELEKWGVKVTYVPVGENGIVDPKKIAEALKPETVLVSIMYANNEIGTIQPIKEISRLIKQYRNDNRKSDDGSSFGSPVISYPYFHTDASQAPNYLSCGVDSLGVDLLTLDGSKIYGPKGVGALYVKRGVEISPIMFGGGQEKGIRPGTENVPLIIGLAEAFQRAEVNREKESERLTELRDYFTEQLLAVFPKAHINGDRKQRLPNNINICFPGINSEFAVIQLDEKGIAAASVSSCKNLSESSTSYIIKALGEASVPCAESSLRFSLGRFTTKKEIDQTLLVLKEIIKA